MFLCQCYGTIRTKTTLPKMLWAQNFWHFFLQLLIHLAPQRNIMRGKARHRNLMGNFCPCMHKVLFIPSLQLAKTPMSTCFPFPLHWCVCKLEGTSHSCLVLSHPVSALAAAVRTTKIINWKMTLPQMYFFVLFSYFPSSLSAGVKCFHLKLLVAIQESATRTRGREKKRLFWSWN